MGFGHLLSFKHIDDEHIDNVEEFIKFKLRDYSKSTCDLFGQMFADNPTQFEFLPGERLLIKELVAYVLQVVDSGGKNKGLHHFQKSIISTETEDVTEKVSNIQQKMFESKTHFFLGKLLDAANRNSSRKKGGYRYDTGIKRYAAYLRMICGPLAYETIQRNLECALPSLTSTNRYIKSANCHVVEGVLRSEELLLYLKERNLPLVISLSKDATRIIGRVQYDAATNQLVGFTLPLSHSNGMPIPYSFPARSAQEIHGHFSNENSISNFLNVIMAQPVDKNSKPFCLLAFGSDNIYTSVDVAKRWNFICTELKKIGINVLTISSDSDPRYNAAMRLLSKLGCDGGRGSNVAWFSCNGSMNGPFFIQVHIYSNFSYKSLFKIFCYLFEKPIQDTIHNGTKLRNFILRTISNRKRLPFGKYFIDWNHLHILLEDFGKDEHQLTISVLNPIDRQNFKSVLRMCAVKVMMLLKSYVKGSEGTVVYLNIMKNIIDAFLDQNLKPIQRVRKMWYSIFIIRMWRNCIMSHKKYNLKDNFLTTPCYTCLELNAHSLIMCMLHLKEINRADLFLPHLFESQPCESMFRQFRSFTTTYSTVTNCTVKEAMARISKIQLQNDIINGTSSHFNYPRLSKQQNSNDTATNQNTDLPTRNEIIAEIQNCQRDALVTARSLGLIINQRHTEFRCKVPPYTFGKIRKRNITKNVTKASLDPPNFNNIQLKNFADKLNGEIISTGPYVEIITDDNKRIVLKKMSLCWLWRAETRKLSNDRLLRVQYLAKGQRSKRMRLRVKKTLFIDTNQ